MPMRLEDIDRFERLNKLSVNEYSIKSEGGWVNPLKMSKVEIKKVALFLLIIDFDKKMGVEKSHYAYINKQETADAPKIFWRFLWILYLFNLSLINSNFTR